MSQRGNLKSFKNSNEKTLEIIFNKIIIEFQNNTNRYVAITKHESCFIVNSRNAIKTQFDLR